jgi:hypothetical protein
VSTSTLFAGRRRFLDDHAPLIEHVRQDLARALKNPHTGRNGITPAQTLRSLILMRVKNGDYREVRQRITTALPCAALPASTASVCPNMALHSAHADQLFGDSVGSGRVLQRRRDTHGTVAHGLAHQGLHVLQLGRIRRAIVVPQHHAAHSSRAYRGRARLRDECPRAWCPIEPGEP